VVELFTALGFAEGPRLRSKNRFRLSPGWKLPTSAELNEPSGPEPLGRDFHPLRRITASCGKAAEVFPCRPVSTRHRAAAQAIRQSSMSFTSGGTCPATGLRPSAECGDHDSPTRFQLSDRTPGLLSRAERRRSRHSIEDYSDEPPSNRTSHSHGIRLYGSASRREVNPAPLDRLVRPVLPGDAAHLEHVSKALRH